MEAPGKRERSRSAESRVAARPERHSIGGQSRSLSASAAGDVQISSFAEGSQTLRLASQVRIDALDVLQLRDDTLVLFVGDNGTFRSLRSKFGDKTIQGMKGRTTCYGTHVPMIANWPGKIAPMVVDDLADSTDILQTVCDVADVEVPEGREVAEGRAELAKAPVARLDGLTLAVPAPACLLEKSSGCAPQVHRPGCAPH